jgi:hypothetical protein
MFIEEIPSSRKVSNPENNIVRVNLLGSPVRILKEGNKDHKKLNDSKNKIHFMNPTEAFKY